MKENQILSGLTENQVTESRKKFGANVETTHDFSTLKLIVKTVFSVFNVMMFSLVVILILVNRISTAEFIGIVAVVNTTIELVQDIRARLIIKKLNKMTLKTVNVMRNET